MYQLINTKSLLCGRNNQWYFLPLFPDLLPPSGLHVLRVEEDEVELRWDLPDPSSQSLVSLIHILFYSTHCGQNTSFTRGVYYKARSMS